MHNIARQILCHILEKCLKVCMLLQDLHYTKPPFQENLIQALRSNLLLVNKDKQNGKIKIKRYGTSFTKSLFDSIFLGCHC